MWRLSAIFWVVFIQGGLVTVNLCRIDLVGMGEDICWLGNIIYLDLCNLLLLLEFFGVALELRKVGKTYWQILGQIGII